MSRIQGKDTTPEKIVRNEADPDDPPPKWVNTIHSASPARIFIITAIWMAVSPKQWVFTLGALGIITAANLSAPVHYLTFVIFVLGTQSLMIGPVLIVVFSPKHSSRFIDMSNAWMERNNRRIVIAMSVIFGAFFFYKGASQLFS